MTTLPSRAAGSEADPTGAAIRAVIRGAIVHCAFVAAVAVAAAYMVLTWDSEAGVVEALRSGSRLDADVAIGMLAYGALHGANLVRDAQREIRALALGARGPVAPGSAS